VITIRPNKNITTDVIALAGEKQAILASIVASSDDAIISKTTKGIITTRNPAAERMFGYTEAVGQPITLIAPEDRHAEETYIIGLILQGKKVEHFETLLTNRCSAFLSSYVTLMFIKLFANIILRLYPVRNGAR
jgi:PAS domain-containing protein